ncbi:MAG TPA: hypothetical protein VLL52_11445 [Anaerolineae bacterium]|nr:hypothetical protein [Anaerolineae bacterium]
MGQLGFTGVFESLKQKGHLDILIKLNFNESIPLIQLMVEELSNRTNYSRSSYEQAHLSGVFKYMLSNFQVKGVFFLVDELNISNQLQLQVIWDAIYIAIGNFAGDQMLQLKREHKWRHPMHNQFKAKQKLMFNQVIEGFQNRFENNLLPDFDIRYLD